MKVFIDTGAFCAIIDKKDRWHAKTSDLLVSLVKNKAVFYTSNFILSETYTLIRIRISHKAAIQVRPPSAAISSLNVCKNVLSSLSWNS